MGNHASRLLRIVDDVAELDPEDYRPYEPAYGAWRQLLGIERHRSDTEFRVAGRLEGLRHRVGLLRDVLCKHPSIVLKAYEELFSTLECLFQISRLGRPWADVRALITPELRAYLASLAAWLPDDDWPSEVALRDVARDVKTLEYHVHESDLPPLVSEFLLARIEELLTAIQDFRWLGPRALTEASDRAAQAWSTAPPIVAQYAETDLVQKVFAQWPKIAKVATHVALVGVFGHAVFVDLPETVSAFRSVIGWVHLRRRDTPLLPSPVSALTEEIIDAVLEEDDEAASNGDEVKME